MTRIAIEPAPLELTLHRDAYEALVTDLEQQGFEAELRPTVEERSGLPQDAANAALWVAETIGQETIALIMGIYLERMRRSRRRRRRPPPRSPVAILYGPDGEALRIVEIPEPDE